MNRQRIVFLMAAMAALVGLLTVSMPLQAQTAVFVNEIHYDNTGTDTGEAIEVAGPAGTDLTGWSLVLYNGSTSLVYDTMTLSGVIPDQDNGFGTVSVSYPTNGIQNGSPDGVALVGPGDSVVQFLSYEGSFTAGDGPANGMTSTDIGVTEGSGTPAGTSLQLTGSGTEYENFAWMAEVAETFGAVNAGQSFGGPPPPPDVTISEIRIDQPSTDNDEYVELAGAAGTALDGLTYLVIGDGTGGSGVIENVTSLSGQTIPGSGFFVAAESTFTLGTANLVTSLNFENSDNVTHLLVAGFTGADGDDLDTDDDGVLDVTPWSAVVDLIALVEEANPPGGTEYHYGPPSVGPDGSFVPGHAFNCEGTWLIGAFDPAAGDDTLGAANACPAADATISEIRIDQPGGDVDEYFELAGEAGASLNGLTYLVIGDGTGGSGVIENVTSLSGQTIPGSGFFVAAESTFTLGTADLVTSLNFENSDNVTHLLVAGFPGADGDDLDTDDDGTLDSTPWAEAVDCVGLVETPGSGEQLYCDTLVGPDGSFVPGHVYLCEDSWRIGAFGGGQDTPGAQNACEVCGDPFTPIYDIQGSGSASPLEGNVVSTEGVVVGDFQANDGDPFNTDLGGFFIQDAAGDGDAATSDGIFVFAPGSMDVQVGDTVRVAGEVDEFFDLTEITNVTTVLQCSSGASVAATEVTLPVNEIGDLEMYEGMLVTFPQELTISEFFNFDRFGEIVLTTERQFQPTAVFEPGSADAAQLAQDNLLGRITLDDGRSNQNPDPARHPNGSEFDLSNRFRGGDTVQNVTGVLSYDFGLYRIQPTTGADYTSQNPRPAAPADVGGNLTVASFNVLNYFNTIDDGVNDICGPLQDQECRGADNEEERARQLAKIVSAMATMDADVVGIIEVENTTGVEAMVDIVDGLNAMLGAGTYDYIDTGTIGTDPIKVGFIYQPATVSPVGDFAVLDTDAFVDPNNLGDPKNRPALAQTFVDNETNGIFTAVVNHLKSKGSPCGSGDDDPEAGSCNLTRTLAAQELADWLATDPTNSGDPDILVIGDLNSYDKEDPIDVLAANGYTDLLHQFVGEFAYSYVFDGQLGYLDYGMANEALLPEVTGITVWHINTDEPDILDYDTSFKQDAQDALYEPNAYRSSDHDPVIVGLDLNGSPVCSEAFATPDMLWPPNHKFVAIDVLGVTDPDGDNVTITIDAIRQDEAVLARGSGKTAPDGRGAGTSTAEVRAERVGGGNGRVYHIYFTAMDEQGNSCTGEVLVGVPKSQGRHGQAIDDGPLYDSTLVP